MLRAAMPSPTTILAIVGIVIVTLLRTWAYRASPNVSAEGADAFRKRLLIYYGAMLVFVAAWLTQYFLLHRNRD
jgi:hypothetical protein